MLAGFVLREEVLITPPNILGEGSPRLVGNSQANILPLILQTSQQSQNVLKRSF
jgi:hypothetical protein